MNDSQHHVARSAVLVMIAFGLSRALGLVRQMVFGFFFGTGSEMAAYVAAFSIPEMLFLVIAGGALGSAFIPTFTARLAEGDTARAWRLASAVVNILLITLVPLSLLCIAVAPWLVQTVVAPALPTDLQLRTAALMRVMLLSTAIFGVSGIVMGALNAHQHFLLPALAPLLYNIALIAGAICGGLSGLGTMGPAIGMVVGAMAHLLVQVPGLLRYKARYTPTLGLDDPSVRKIGLLMAPRVFGVAAVQLNIVIGNNLASRLGVSAISALQYAWRLMLLPQGIFAQAVGTAVFPTFSAQAALGKTEALRDTLASTLRIVIAITIPAAAGLVVLGHPVIALIFQRGAFTETSTDAVTWALVLYAVGLVGHSLIEVLARAFYALHDTWTPAAAAAATVLLNVVLGLVLPAAFGGLGLPAHGGLALANSLAALAEMGLLLALINRRVRGLDGARVFGQSLRVCVATAGMVAVLVLWLRLVPSGALLQSVGGFALGLAAYAGLATLLGVRELRQAITMVMHR